MEWTSDVTKELLNLYEAEPAIWNSQNEHYKDRHKVHDAWKRIQARISVDCSVKYLKRKMENLMSTFMKLSEKVKKSATAGSGTCDVYKPEWFAYEKMASFLLNVYEAKGTPTTEGPQRGNAPDEDNTPVDNEDKAFDAVNDAADPSTVRNGSNDDDRKDKHLTARKGGPPDGKRMKSEKRVHADQRTNEAFKCMKVLATKARIEKRKIQQFCDLMHIRLEALDDRKRDFAMHQIEIEMFKAKYPNCVRNGVPNQLHLANYALVGITPNQYQLQMATKPEQKTATVGSLNMDTKNIKKEFKIDIEEGRELEDIKEDPSKYGTVRWTENNTLVEVKKEPPEENGDLGSGEVTRGPDQSLICNICSVSCATKEDMKLHFNYSHSGIYT